MERSLGHKAAMSSNEDNVEVVSFRKDKILVKKSGHEGVNE